jgi:hypothetical protein
MPGSDRVRAFPTTDRRAARGPARRRFETHILRAIFKLGASGRRRRLLAVVSLSTAFFPRNEKKTDSIDSRSRSRRASRSSFHRKHL